MVTFLGAEGVRMMREMRIMIVFTCFYMFFLNVFQPGVHLNMGQKWLQKKSMPQWPG